jgi:hypothetical protein
MKDNRVAFSLLAGFTLLFTISCFLFTASRGPLKFDPASLPEAQHGVPYDARITISGNATPVGEFSLSEGSLPPGLTLGKVEGENAARLFGIPAQSGAFKFKVYVWCYGTNVSGQVGEMEYSLVVK